MNEETPIEEIEEITRKNQNPTTQKQTLKRR